MKQVLPLLALLAAGTAVAAGPAGSDGKAPAKPALSAASAAAVPYAVANCFNCHGTDGKTSAAIPPLAGRDRVYIEETLKAYKSGAKPATIMHQLAKGYTDEELAVFADYFSQQK
ncbi:c-type cytochrome [Rhodocyclus tenuis]|uniref:Cytochrome c553 n=1 Tax=Rhodocyclus tenuis TaxID=1066 RepID=A0A840FWH2_RHOTE|nr:c-type cytochrome [Rhodocyclus tenuis]MBB4246437.1 cytochrome c553 [Rhodocyclus tenuis]